MHKNPLALLLAAVMLITILSACVLPASQAPKATPPSSTEMPFPLITQPGAFSDILKGTQTAQAVISSPTIEISTNVPEVQITAVTEKPSATAKPTKTPKPKIVVPSPTPGRPATYTLQHGEYLICIARRFNVDLNDLFYANGMNMYSRPYIGTVLTIPQNDSWNTAFGPRQWHAHPSQYTVKSTDNIYTIACYFGDIDPSSILIANNLQGAYTLTPGEVINIP